MKTQNPAIKSELSNTKKNIHEPCLGETIGGFKLIEQLHQSRVSTLYFVTHKNLDHKMVMKVPKIQMNFSAAIFAGFETELRILSRLHGVYTPRVIAKGDMASCPYIIMEYIEGELLQKAIIEAPVKLEQLTELMIPVCKAVHELHRHNIIHLDIKPQNIRNRKNGKIVLLDFGSAHHTRMPDMYEANPEEAPHTIDYVAPEQLCNIRHDSRSDIFALGVLLYQLATGKLPFGRANSLTVKAYLSLPPTPPRTIDSSLPPWLQEIILKCLQRKPDNRFASAKQLAYALAHPNMVVLGKLASLTKKPGIWQKIHFWFNAQFENYQQAKFIHPYQRISKAPHVLLALDLEHSSLELNQALRNTLQRLVLMDKHSFYTVMTVIENNELNNLEDYGPLITQETPKHIQLLIELRHWMKLLKIPESRVNYKVVTGHVANEIIHYATHNVVDHIVLGARGSSSLRRYMGSVSNKVVAEVPCSVTVVRSRLAQETVN